MCVSMYVDVCRFREGRSEKLLIGLKVKLRKPWWCSDDDGIIHSFTTATSFQSTHIRQQLSNNISSYRTDKAEACALVYFYYYQQLAGEGSV